MDSAEALALGLEFLANECASPVTANETTFFLNNLAIISVDDRKIRVGHISEVLKPTGKQPLKAQPKLTD